ncbi:hypothetical protein GQX74_012962 [Glossina fuscipes]|nr:hypothetical protein GQX74_012962 [Glossina fuscipes]
MINGKILFMIVKGKGHPDIHLKNVTNKIIVNVGLERKQGQTFVIVKDVICDFQPQDVFVHFDSLFDGNKELTESINKVVNTNWREFHSTLRDNIIGAFSQAILNVLRNVVL